MAINFSRGEFSLKPGMGGGQAREWRDRHDRHLLHPVSNRRWQVTLLKSDYFKPLVHFRRVTCNLALAEVRKIGSGKTLLARRLTPILT